MRIDARRNNVGKNLLAALQSDAAGSPILDKNFRDPRLSTNFHAGFARRIGNGIRNSPCPAAAETPGAKSTINFAHVMMQKNVGSARRAYAKKGPNDTRSRHRGLKHIGLKPLVEKIGGAQGHQ